MKQWVLAVALLATPMFVTAEDPRQAQSRALAQAFGQELKQALQSAMASGGPVAAIGVCRDAAPRIASQAARQHGVRIGRTSLKVRNPLNLPEAWQREVLEDFARRFAEGEAPLEYFDRGAWGARYMSSIDVKGLCLACHGEQLAPETARALAIDYPHDQATGYRAGDLRGAFSITWPPGDGDVSGND